MNKSLQNIIRRRYSWYNVEIARKEGISYDSYRYLINETFDECDMKYIQEINKKKYGFNSELVK